MSAKLPKNGEKDIRTQDAIRNIMLRSLTDDLKYQHKEGVNYVQVMLGEIQACNYLFLKITTMFFKVMPIAVFCSIASMILVMGIDPLIGMFRCMSNCLGDVVVTSIVAKSEDQINMEVYRQ